MSGHQELLRLRILLAFLKHDETCTIMGIARTLGETKQDISRMVIALEKEGMIDRTDIRHPVLTVAGEKMAENYSRKVKIAMQFLIDENVSINNATKDASYWAIHSSDETMEIFKKLCQKKEIRKLVKHKHTFNGTFVNKNLEEGNYEFPFFIHSCVDMKLNEYFEHPCVCHIENKQGRISLKSLNVSGIKIRSAQYFDNGIFVSAEKNGDIIRIPLEVFEFVNYGEGKGQILQGTIDLKIQYKDTKGQVLELTSLFTVFV